MQIWRVYFIIYEDQRQGNHDQRVKIEIQMKGEIKQNWWIAQHMLARKKRIKVKTKGKPALFGKK